MKRAVVALAVLLMVLQLQPVAAETSTVTVGKERPALVVLPDAAATAPQPLLLVLHGYTSSGEYMDQYLQLRPEAAKRGVVLAFPNGTKEQGTGTPFWQGTSACCNFAQSTVDDVAYLVDLVDEIAAVTPIDRRRVYVFGHSNGSFMGYKLACTRPDVFAAVAGLAGATFAKRSDCRPSVPISILHMHGTADETIPIDGTVLAAPVPSAMQTVKLWAGYNTCAVTKPMKRGKNIDIIATLKGAETQIYSYACPKGINVDFWKAVGAVHSPKPNANFPVQLFNWLLKHRR